MIIELMQHDDPIPDPGCAQVRPDQDGTKGHCQGTMHHEVKEVSLGCCCCYGGSPLMMGLVVFVESLSVEKKMAVVEGDLKNDQKQTNLKHHLSQSRNLCQRLIHIDILISESPSHFTANQRLSHLIREHLDDNLQKPPPVQINLLPLFLNF